MICHTNGTMIPDNQCFQTSAENPGCPLFVCEPPQTTFAPLENDEAEDNTTPPTTNPQENEGSEENTDEPPNTTINQFENVESDRDVGENPFFSLFLKKLMLFQNMH